MILTEDATPPAFGAELERFGEALHQGLDHVTALERSLQRLDDIMLTGRPHAIADAALAVELSLSEAEPIFLQIGDALSRLAAPRLQDAARQLRRSDQVAAAAAAEALRSALKRFVRRSAACHRRAQSLSRGLNASLRTLHALGSIEHGRLIAEA